MEEENISQEQLTPPALPGQQPQKRILALSIRGDTIHRLAVPVLNWMIENGDPELQARALKTRAYWEQEQQWFVDWGNKTRFFELAEQAVRDIKKFKQAMAIIPENDPGILRIVGLALLAAEAFNKPIGLKWKNSQSRGKKRRGK